MCLYRIIFLETGGGMSKHKQWSLNPNQMINLNMINLNKRFSDLKEKQKAKIAEWLYIETYRFYKEHDHMPYHSEKQAVLDTVYAMIEKAGIRIPYAEVEIYYRSKISRYRSRILRNCHYTFECPELPTRCPDCGKETRSHKVGSRIVSLPCVREATEAEIDCYKRIQRELAEEESQAAAASALADKLMALGDPFSFEDDPYDMPVHEHNFALMLVYYTHTMGFYGKRDLNRMIVSIDIQEKMELFKKVRLSFVQAINRESQDNQNALFLDREIWEKATPALKTLYLFRQDNDLKLLLQNVPNRGNIRRIDLQKIAESPSEGLVRFMTELYNELR